MNSFLDQAQRFVSCPTPPPNKDITYIWKYRMNPVFIKALWPLEKPKSLKFSVLALPRHKRLRVHYQQSSIMTQYLHTSEGFEEGLCNISQLQPALRIILQFMRKVLRSENCQGSKDPLTVLRSVHMGMVNLVSTVSIT